MSGELGRRRELARMTKAQLIDRVCDLETYAEIVQEVYGASSLEAIRERNARLPGAVALHKRNAVDPAQVG